MSQSTNTQNTTLFIVKEVFTFRWRPTSDLLMVAFSWILVVAGLYTATFIVGSTALGGMGYFLTYAVLTTLAFGICIPVGWMLFVRKSSPVSLGITSKNLFLSILLQLVFAIIQFLLMRSVIQLPPFRTMLPLIALSLCTGFFEAVFWRGWVQMRIERSFGVIPGILLGSALYALYHVGYGMPWSEIYFLFFIGLMFAIIFRITSNIFILWPVFQSLGQVTTLVRDKLELPFMAVIGFAEVLAAMIIVVVIAFRLYNKRTIVGGK
ncbi:MAG TPA: type II CAAX endopeptidase family protein [Syntrophorhabdaceae bacterium]|nr:type II CAAX endopeptidase family protein [Syntrophorhabdaceae bacterium]